MVGRTTKPTAAQSRRMDAISQMRCVACEIAGQRQPNRTECHHLTDKGNRRASGGHDATIPLCVWMHRGIPLRGKTLVAMEREYGPSLALSKRAFKARYGDERALLAIVNKKLEGEA